MDGAPTLNNLWELFFQNILSNFFANFYVKILIFIKKKSRLFLIHLSGTSPDTWESGASCVFCRNISGMSRSQQSCTKWAPLSAACSERWPLFPTIPTRHLISKQTSFDTLSLKSLYIISDKVYKENNFTSTGTYIHYILLHFNIQLYHNFQKFDKTILNNVSFNF